MSEYSSESGHRAKPGRVIDKIYSKLEKVGVQLEGDRPEGLDWNNEEHRDMVLSRFEENADGELDESLLPGFGPDGWANNARDDCGEKHPFVCEECGNDAYYGRTCGQSVCARCAVAWTRDSGKKKTAKVRRIRIEKNQNTPGKELQKLHHQIISPPLGWWFDLARGGYTLEKARETTKEVVKWILSEMRAQGIVAMHPYRGKKEDGGLTEDVSEMDIGEWKERLFNGRVFWNDVREELAWQPHYHCVVVSDWLKGDGFTDKIEAATGWVIHRITRETDDGRTVSLETDGDMAKAADRKSVV